jgi:DNA-binding beta-propeller fold protein YncE
MMRKFIALCSGFALAVLLPSAALARAAAWDDPANVLFTAESGGEVVTVIDVTGDRIVGRIETGYPIDDIAASGFGDYAFASHAEEKKITVINLRSRKIEALVPVSIKPRHLTFEQNSGLVMTDSIEGGMAMLDPRGAGEVFSNPDIPPSRDIIFGPTGIVAYYHSGEAGIVGAVAMDSGRSLWQVQVPVSKQSIPLVRSLDGLFLVFVLPDKGEVHALMAANGKHIGSAHLGRGLSRPYVTANGQYFLVAEQTNQQVHVLSQSNFSKLVSMRTGQPTTLVASGLFDVMAVAFADSTLYAMDLMKFAAQPAHEMPIRGQATDVIVTSDSRHAYVAIPSADTIAHLNLRSGELSYIEGIQSPAIVTMGVSNAVCH